MDLWKSLAGMVEVELTSAELGNAFAAINARNIPLFSVKYVGELTARMRILRKDYPLLSALAEKRGEKLRITSHRGLFWLGKALGKRPVLLCGLVLFLMLALYLPTRIFFVRVDGNTAIPTGKILEAAEESGIRFGASRRKVRSEKVKNALLEAVPELQWAGVNTAGCVATISVRERSIEEPDEPHYAVSSIVALRDGVVLSVTATVGNSLCRVGQAVKVGQTLISGYTDCGICIRAERAEGEILAQTSRALIVITPSEYAGIREKTLSGRKISLLLGKKRINLWKDSGIPVASCGRMYEEYYITLPGGFQLPIALCLETFLGYETSPLEYPQQNAEESLGVFSVRYLSEQMVAGTILSKLETISSENGVYRLDGHYICTEMIGRVQQEQIGDTNGKSD